MSHEVCFSLTLRLINRGKYNDFISIREPVSIPKRRLIVRTQKVLKPTDCSLKYTVCNCQTHASYWKSRLYLTGVATAQLRWHLSNMNVTGTFAISNILLTAKLTNRASVTPTPGIWQGLEPLPRRTPNVTAMRKPLNTDLKPSKFYIFLYDAFCDIKLISRTRTIVCEQILNSLNILLIWQDITSHDLLLNLKWYYKTITFSNCSHVNKHLCHGDQFAVHKFRA